MASNEAGATTPTGPVLFAYDGSELAALAIEQAGRQLAPGQEALVVCVWQPADVGFVPVGSDHLDAGSGSRGQGRRRGGRRTRSGRWRTGRGSAQTAWPSGRCPTWKGIVETAEERDASLIVLGSHRRTGLVGHLLGSVAAAVVSHAACSVLVVHQRS